MFNKDFYPTPQSVIDTMLFGIDFTNKVVLEPHGGKGNIIDVLNSRGAKEVLSCEINDTLRKTLAGKCRIIESDFLNVKEQDVSHINYIIANPPFSCEETHIKKMWDIAPEGCVIITLCNSKSYHDPFSRLRKEVKNIVDTYGSFEFLGEVFADSERETNVAIGLIKLYKPVVNEEKEFENYFDLEEEVEQQDNGIIQYSEIRNIVNRYVGAVKQFNTVLNANIEINKLIAPINKQSSIHFGAYKTQSGRVETIDRDTFKKELQKSAWKTIFSMFEMDRYVTKNVMSDINKFVETQQNVPFTVSNIQKMVNMIVGTSSQTMDKVLLEAFDAICSFSSENSEAKEGWKTNSNYKVNQKFIHPYLISVGYNGNASLKHYNSHYEIMDDITKALCYVTGKKYEVQGSTFNLTKEQIEIENNEPKHIWHFFQSEKIQFGDWYKWNDFFEIKCFKKGTMHVRFIDESVWLTFNQRVSKIKWWVLPTQTDEKKKGTERTKSKGVVKL